MKHTLHISLFITFFLLFFASSLYSSATSSVDFFHAKHGEVEALIKAIVTQEAYASARTTFLNDGSIPFNDSDYQTNYDAAMNDRSLLFRSTTDFLLSFIYGDVKKPLVQFYNCLRFRYVFGGPGVVTTETPTLQIEGATLPLNALSIPKHLLWTNEAWLHIALNKTDDSRDLFLRSGLFPYDIGRGIALGSAYATSGFLGATPEFSIDQYAPGVWLHAEIFPKKFDLNTYFALLINQSDSFGDNNALIRTQDISQATTGPTRGTNTQVWVFSLSSKWYPVNEDNKRASIEPFLIQYHAPDQTLEFYADSNLYLRTFGVGVEHFTGDFEWGLEVAFNGGYQEIRAWDRNQNVIGLDPNGNLQIQYTEVNLENPGLGISIPAYPAIAVPLSTGGTFNVATAVANSLQNFLANGAQLNPTASFLVIDGVNYDLLNSEIRFRPEQRVFFDGFYCTADVGYQILKDRLKIYAGMGYASGELDNLEESITSFTEQGLLERRFHGFFPIQSVYSGGNRLNLFVLLNQGVPRFDQQNPVPTVPIKNYITPIQGTQNTLQINAFTNLMYMGGAIEWNPDWLAAYKSGLKANVIYYRMPVTPNIPGSTLLASHSLGLEFNVRQTATIFNRVSLMNAFGVLFPGQLYTDMKGTSISGGISGDSPTYAINIGISVAF